MSSTPQILRPTPRRPFDHSSAPPQPPSPTLAPLQTDSTPSRAQSFLNLTSSTLLGIYSPTGGDDTSVSTPWGTGSQTPRTPSFSSLTQLSFSRPRSQSQARLPAPQRSTARGILGLTWRAILLFGIGMGYGVLVRHLHNDRQLAPFQVEGIIKPRNDWRYLAFWGVAGVLLGSAMPWVDTLFSEPEEERVEGKRMVVGEDEEEAAETGILGADWTPVVRSVGAFVGIAFAIRKLPWASTLQASLTLFLVNPVLWYLIDRSTPGFILSASVGFTGTALLLASNPDMMPSPTASSSIPRNNNSSTGYMGGSAETVGGVRRETVEVAIWIISVLFCSCVCFGNIGRRLALSGVRDRGVRRV